MAYNSIDIVNLRDCVRSLKKLQDSILSLFREYTITLVRFESFLDRYEDVPSDSDDLPL